MKKKSFNFLVLYVFLSLTAFAFKVQPYKKANVSSILNIKNIDSVQKGPFSITADDANTYNCIAFLTSSDGAYYASLSDVSGEYEINITSTYGGYDEAAYEIYGTVKTDYGTYNVAWTTPINWSPENPSKGVITISLQQ
ncbi:hypothetical protein [Arachidicoccus soli]|uniref:Carboxypeptidase regulatory-like domain-containing protein n=1 Tax=Arachidicoccus soli TaxID=2341117 RepID=A0A386HRM2_9BACT|nr:hypothetical protein [Arachidicoccus soli]AYD48433.1 hypothetical protein D6B99_12965 [Arachidicoccus soli]